MQSTVANVAPASTFKEQVRAKDLLSLLDNMPSTITTLSLDCFDTLLWRNTATPTDVFYDLYANPTFKALGISASLRAKAEDVARRRKFLALGSSEVNLKEIYLAEFPDLSDSELRQLEMEEIATENKTLYCFPPMVELIRTAHARGLKIVIVSDTYFTTAQLTHLLENKLEQDVFKMITKIFCSSDFGKSKSSGLFHDVLKKNGKNPQAVLHIGDHRLADYLSPRALGIHATHFAHHENVVSERIRMQAVSGGLMDPSIRYQRGLVSPFRGMFAQATINMDLPETAIGYTSLGPIMYAFSRFIVAEMEKLHQSGKRPKVLFLMRDAYLPYLACTELAGQELGKCGRISRFASYAASFRNKQDVDTYIGENAESKRFLDLCRQLLLPEKIALEICQEAEAHVNPALCFVKLIQRPQILKVIFKASLEYRKRLIKHVENTVGLAQGDTLVFVDLGYTGTSQIKLEPVFREELAIELRGCYLIALRTPGWEKSRSGLLDPSWCDDRMMNSLVAYIALLEQLCTSNEKSVVDYDENGNPIYSNSSVKKAQHGKLDLIQAESLRFIREAELFAATSGNALSISILRDTAMAEISRLLFIPSQSEIDYLKTFEFELNLGTSDILTLFDEEKGLTGLRRRGLFFMEKNLKSMRTNYPAELRSAGLELALTLMSQHRYMFDIRASDFSFRREIINIIVMKDGKPVQASIAALPTYDGYFCLLVPIGSGQYQVGMQFGLNFQWVQIECAEIILTNALYSSLESANTIDAKRFLTLDDLQDHGNGLYHCKNKSSLLIYHSTESHGNDNYALRVVFRPITGQTPNK